jgi:hypothetical protein
LQLSPQDHQRRPGELKMDDFFAAIGRAGRSSARRCSCDRGDDRPQPADRGLIKGRPLPAGFQGFGGRTLPASRFSAPFFFCLGFLASRLDRFCSLFAIRLLLLAALRRNMPEKPLIQPLK